MKAIRFKFLLSILTTLVSALSLSSPAAFSASLLSCAAPEALDAGTQDCYDNETYAEAGVLCLQALEDLVQLKAKEAAKKMGAADKKSMNDKTRSQVNSMGTSSEDYGISVDTLNQLLTTAKYAKEQTTQYLKDIYMPEGFELVESLGGDIEDYLRPNPCYQENYDVLVDVNKDIDKIIQDLEKTKTMAAQLGAHADQNKTKIDASSPNALIKGGQAQGTGNLPAGTSKARDSDVSGIKENEAQKKIVK